MKEVSKQEQVELLQWLFGKDIEIKQEIDIALAPYYEDINVYYTKEIYNLFQTEVLKREGKIMQLGAKIFREPNSYHTRLEHSKGAYRKIVEFLAIKYKDAEWRKYIEENRLKGYLVEKIKFMCVHDVGHSMFSHSIEKLIGDENCTHEDIGEKILQENEEIKKALSQIKANEKDSNLQGDGSLELFCEGNIDFDRMDFILRDRLYTGEKAVDDLVLELETMCNLKWVEEEKGYRYVYTLEALPYIEKFLEVRDYMYRTEYSSKQRVRDDKLSSNLIQSIMSGEIKGTEKIREYLRNVVGKDLEDINIEDYLQTNDILFLSELIRAINDNDLATNEMLHYIMPDNQTLLQISISLLDPKNTEYSKYSEEEKEFIRNLRNMITKRTNESKMNIEELIVSVQLKEDKRREIETRIQKVLGKKELTGIYSYQKTFRKYKKEEPIYIEDENGQILSLDKQPKVQIDLSDGEEYGTYVILPELRNQGVQEKQIEQIQEIIEEYQKQEINQNINLEKNRMNMFKTQHEPINYVEKMNQFFQEEER